MPVGRGEGKRRDEHLHAREVKLIGMDESVRACL
jgi:hypothetical protein